MKKYYEASKMKKILPLIIAIMIMAYPATLIIVSGAPFHKQEVNEVKIGVVTSRSGALGYYGDMEINGMILGLMYELNISSFETVVPNMEWRLTYQDKVIHIIAEDDVDPQTGLPDPSIATQKARKLIEEKGVHILQGSASSSSAIAITSIAEQYGIVFLVSPAADADITSQYFNKYVFQISSNTWHDAIAGGTWAVENLGKKFAFIAPDYSWGYSTVECWSTVIKEHGGEIVDVEYAPLTTTDFTPYIQRILASEAEVLIPVWAGGTAVYLYAQLKALGVYEQMNVTSGIPDLATLNLLLAQYLPAYTGMMKYAWSLPDNDVNDWLVNKYVELYKQGNLPTMGVFLPAFPLPDLFVGNGFMVGQAIARALLATNWDPSSDALISALEDMEFDSPKGRVKIRAVDHRTIQDMYIVKIVFDNETLHRYYENISYLPALYQPFYNVGFLRPELVERMEAVSPPVEVQTGISPFIIQMVSIAIILIIVVIVAVFIYYRKRKQAT